jgi:hypothetical protein
MEHYPPAQLGADPFRYGFDLALHRQVQVHRVAVEQQVSRRASDEVETEAGRPAGYLAGTQGATGSRLQPAAKPRDQP